MLCKFAWWSYPAPSTLSRHWFRLLRPHEVFPPLSPLRWTQNLAGQATCQDWRLPGTGPGGMGDHRFPPALRMQLLCCACCACCAGPGSLLGRSLRFLAKRRASPTIRPVDAASHMRLDHPLRPSWEHQAAKRFEVGTPSAIRWTAPQHSIANQLRELPTRISWMFVAEFSSKLFTSLVPEVEQIFQTRSFPTKSIVHAIFVNPKVCRIPLHCFQFLFQSQPGLPRGLFYGRPNLLKSAPVVHPGDVDGTGPPT